ncbi:NUDIX hydrolase [Truepera radiovictrix DSM 17093]|uniref:NUDIX hydrolase n=2 Tax=Truepera TaxID=332248 RepID=D7CY92_TRURR|nr:NUDIX hydrolase [Truepera radiovictrix]ADI14731.1 NUDIX hydrolase [Truepera radiovictrix DSM 17093]WMT56719.1 NUDIX hydrolase [Truepera radiovictrix]
MSDEILFEGRVIRVAKRSGRWEVVFHAPAVCVLALRGERGREEVLLVEQLRPAVGQVTWELPAGLVDPGETPAAAARRELAEEVGLAGTLTQLAEVYSSPGFTDEKVTLFMATDLHTVARAGGDEGEEVAFAWRPLRETWARVAAGEVASSAPTLLGLTYALGRAGALAEPS